MSKQSDSTKPMGIAFVGCGFVADLYAQTLPSQAEPSGSAQARHARTFHGSAATQLAQAGGPGESAAHQ